MALRDRLLSRLRRAVAPPASFAPAASPPPPPPALPVRQDAETRRDSYPMPYLPWAAQDGSAYSTSSIFATAPLPDELLWLLYSFSGVAHRYVELPAERATRKGWTCTEVPEEESKRLDVYNVVADGIRWSRLWGGAVGVLVTDDAVSPRFRRANGGDPRQWLREPLDLARVRRLERVVVFDAAQASVLETQRNPLLPGFQDPLLWSISAEGWYGTVHTSRVVHFRGRKRPPSKVAQGGLNNSMPDDSVLQVGWRALDLLLRTMDAGGDLAEAFQETLVKISNLASIATGDEAAGLNARLALMDMERRRSGLIVLDTNDEYETRTHSPAGFDALTGEQMRWLAAELGWPQSLLFGDGPGGLSTDDKGGREQERQIWSDTQEHHRKAIERIYEVLLASREGPTGGKVPDEWALTFAPLDEPDEKSVAELREVYARIDETYVGLGVYGPEVVAEQRFGPEGWTHEITDVPVPDSEAELERQVQAELARQQLEGTGGDPTGTGGDPTGGGGDPEDEREDWLRHDAFTGCCVMAPVPDLGLRTKVEQAIGQRLTGGEDPHATILFLGPLAAPESVSEVVSAVAEEVADIEARTLQSGTLRTFRHGEDGTPVVLELSDAWMLHQLNERLLRRLAHLVTAKQFARYQCHVTVGYAPEPLSTEALRKLLAIDTSDIRVPVVAVEVRNAEALVASLPVGG